MENKPTIKIRDKVPPSFDDIPLGSFFTWTREIPGENILVKVSKTDACSLTTGKTVYFGEWLCANAYPVEILSIEARYTD